MAIAAHLVVAGTVGASRLVTARSGGLTLEELLNRPSWHADAACRCRSDVSWFDGDPAAAIAICAGCLVRDECEAFADDDPELSGIWGARLRPEPVPAPPPRRPKRHPKPVPVTTKQRLRGEPDPVIYGRLAPVRCSCGKRSWSLGIWRAHVRGSLEAHPGSVHELV